MKEQGTVKWFDPSKGYGFIECLTGPDAFVHWNDIVGDKNLMTIGLAVEFDLVNTAKGLRALNVRPL